MGSIPLCVQVSLFLNQCYCLCFLTSLSLSYLSLPAAFFGEKQNLNQTYTQINYSRTISMMTPLFTTNGMFIIDEIHTNTLSYEDIPGGGGMFAVLGACIISPTTDVSKRLKWIVDRGTDFPKRLTEQLETWNSGVCFRDDDSRLTTRGWNFYGEKEFREFKYLSPKKRIDVVDWCEQFGSENVGAIPCFHLLCSGKRSLDIMDKLKPLCKSRTEKVFVWEPIPDLCDVGNFQEIKEVMNREEVVIISPNAEEASRLFGFEEEPVTIDECCKLAWRFDDFIKDENSCVLRCGRLGSIVLTPRINGSREVFRFPAYHFNSPSKVVDPTGGGNTFLGGFSIGYTLSRGDLQIANICGNIAAGAAIEQIGVPSSVDGKWNGKSFKERLSYYIETYKLSYNADKIYKILKESTV